MGKNGAGKSTLLKIMAGVRQATRGTVSAPKDCVIAYLPQHLMTEDGRTVFEETCQAFAHLHEIQAEIDRINTELTTRTDYESDDYMQLIEKVSTLSEKFYAIDMTHFEEDVEKTLLGLGFERSDFNRPTSEFSGGWRMRIELAKLLLKSPDVLLLDEPTNHLDIESIGWLEDFIINSSKAVVVISHDRKFVDNITTRTIEVTMGRIYDYKASYSHYLELRKERREQQMKQYEEQQKMIAETKDFIERFKGTYSKTFQVQSRVKMLEKLELIEVDEEDTSRLRLKFPPSPRSGAYPVQMSDVAMSFDHKTIFSGVNLTVERGDKIAFVGRNGEGKSTLVKCIMGQLQNQGQLNLGHNVQIGYFAQNQASLLDGELTVFQTIDDVAKGEIRNKIRDLLGAFMFGGEDSTKKVNVYDAFIEGAKEGFTTAVKIIPYLVAILVGIGVFRASGAMDMVIQGISWSVEQCGLNADFVGALPTAIMKPLSGSGARGMMLEAMKNYGPDSFVGRLSCIFQGSTDTTFYILAVYFGSVSIRNTRHAVACGLLADLAGVIAAIAIAYLFFG